MSLVALVIILAVVGFLLWLIETYVPMDATVKRIIQIVILVAMVLWLLNLFGLLGSVNAIRVGHVN